MADLSILIPSRNEMFLSRTIQDILEHAEGNTEVIAVLDGAWADPPIPDHPKVHLVYHSQSIGQRAATNEAAMLATGKYVMKCDAHCAFDQGFDVKLMADMQDDWTMVPIMRNLHAFDWVCPNGHRRYQGPSGPCKECGGKTTRDVVWVAKKSPQSKAYCFDPTPHFQYFKEFSKRPEGIGDLTETMSLQGSCFLMTRARYFDLDVCDELFGSWGSQGIEVAVKSWLSGGKVVVNQKTWYAHMFRTQGGDFGFPYPMSGNQVEHAKKQARKLFFENKWTKQVMTLEWLVERFWPVPGWSTEDLAQLKPASARSVIPEVKDETIVLEHRDDHPGHSAVPGVSVAEGDRVGARASNAGVTKGLVYYTDMRLEGTLLADVVRHQLARCAASLDGHRGESVSLANMTQIVSVSLKPLAFGRNIVLNRQRGILTMFKQILVGLEASTADIVFLCEHDIFYARGHFDFVPPEHDAFYYNENTWKVRAEDGLCVFYYTKQTSGLCAYRDLLIEHYRKRIAKVEQNARDMLAKDGMVKNEGFSRHLGFEPGCHRYPRGVDNYPAKRWMSEYPNLDIRHDKNLTPNRWSRDLFRDPNSCLGWTEVEAVNGWGKIKGRFNEFLQDVERGLLPAQTK